MKFAISLILKVTLLFLIASLADSQLSFLSHSEQCDGRPHSLTGSETRKPLDRVVDGLGLLGELTRFNNVTEDSAPYVPVPMQATSGGIFDRGDLRKLIKILLLPHIIANRPLQERIGFEIPTAGLRTVTEDLCKVLQHHLGDGFHCTEGELRDLDTRLVYADLVENSYTHLSSITNTPQSDPTAIVRQCQHWNTHAMEGCSDTNALTAEEFEVHAHVVEFPLYREHCTCDSTPLCAVRGVGTTSF